MGISNYATLSQLNLAAFAGVQNNTGVILQGPALWNTASLSQANVAFAAGTQNNTGVIVQGH
ncbi:MAG TPA: hypothetical protein VKV26_13245 [Dehalococcoidia bacterium]|nr:hypothetical protein [Dehalococcoidia bacterium]